MKKLKDLIKKANEDLDDIHSAVITSNIWSCLIYAFIDYYLGRHDIYTNVIFFALGVIMFQFIYQFCACIRYLVVNLLSDDNRY